MLMPIRRVAALVLVLALPAATTAGAVSTREHSARIERDIRPPIRTADPKPQTLAQAMAAHRVPSISVAVADHGKIVWARAWGWADLHTHRPATVRTLYQAGSVSKPVAAGAALRLVEQGRLSLDADINSQLRTWRLPDSPAAHGRTVTLRQLLTHTAGLTVHGFPGYVAGAQVPTVVQVLDGAAPANTAAVRIEREPGTVWNYSGGGITIAQLMMTEAAAEPFPKLMQRLALGPAGMTHSTYEQPPAPPFADEAATGYTALEAPVPGRYHVYPEMAAAGLWTTPEDLVKWALALQRAYAGQGSALMSAASARAMLTPGLGHWGLGIEVVGDGHGLRFSHGGDDAGFKTQIIGWMSGGRAIAVMSNGDASVGVERSLLQAIAREYGWGDVDP